jgi:hypothetical protein
VLVRLATEIDSRGLMTRVSCLEAVLAGDWVSLAITTTRKVPSVAGVPLIEPAVLMRSPAGRPLAVQVYGALPPVALTVAPW